MTDTKKIELLKEIFSKQEAHVLWDALHTHHAHAYNNGTLLKSEAVNIKWLITLLHKVAFK